MEPDFLSDPSNGAEKSRCSSSDVVTIPYNIPKVNVYKSFSNITVYKSYIHRHFQEFYGQIVCEMFTEGVFFLYTISNSVI